jgi:hypothetical protein
LESGWERGILYLGCGFFVEGWAGLSRGWEGREGSKRRGKEEEEGEEGRGI